MEQGNVTFALQADLGNVQLDSISSYQFMDRTLGTDVDGTLIRQADFILDDDVDQYSQEVRLSGSAGDSMDWIFGLFYSRDDVDSVVDGNFSDLVAAFTGGAVTDERLRQPDRSAHDRVGGLRAHANGSCRIAVSLTLAARFTDEEKEFTATATDLSLLGGTGGGFFGLPRSELRSGAGCVQQHFADRRHECVLARGAGLQACRELADVRQHQPGLQERRHQRRLRFAQRRAGTVRTRGSARLRDRREGRPAGRRDARHGRDLLLRLLGRADSGAGECRRAVGRATRQRSRGRSEGRRAGAALVADRSSRPRPGRVVPGHRARRILLAGRTGRGRQRAAERARASR